jgi:hypothetical protein
MPTNPNHFALCEQGIKAARTLQGYQENDEQLVDRTPVLLCEQPMLENGMLLVKHPVYRKGYPYEHESDAKDEKIIQVMEDLNDLNYSIKAEWFDYNVEHCPSEIGHANAIWDGAEIEDIRAMYNDMAAYRGWSVEKLAEEGLSDWEDEFGDNPGYLAAKIQYWAQREGINGLELIV